MTEIYCPFCQKTTSVSEENGEYACSECGFVFDESPIQDPGSSGENFEQRAINLQHWSQSLGGAVGTNWAQLQALRNEDSPAGLAFRRHEKNQSSLMYANNLASISSVCTLLNLDASLRKRIEETWYSIRGPYGLAKICVGLHVAPLIGLAVLYWICRSEGMKISPTRLTHLAGVDKRHFLQASMKVEKILGFPVSEQEKDLAALQSAAESRPLSVSEALAKIRSKNLPLAEEAEILMKTLLRLDVAKEEYNRHLAVACAFYFQGKFEKRPKNFTLMDFCKAYSISFNSSLHDFEQKLRRILILLVAEFTADIAPVEEGIDFVIAKIHDFVAFSDVYSAGDLPETIRALCHDLN